MTKAEPGSPWLNSAVTANIGSDRWDESPSWRIHLLVSPDDDGFSAVALNLPGVGSCGDTEEEAISNAVDAAGAVLSEYLTCGEQIPWVDSTREPVPAGSKARWVIVNG